VLIIRIRIRIKTQVKLGGFMAIVAAQASVATDDITAKDISAVQNGDKSTDPANISVSNNAEQADGSSQLLPELANEPLERVQLESVAQQLQEFMQSMNRSVQFQVDEDSGRDVIRVLDKQNGEVIKQYPSEEVLSLVSKLSQSAGLLVDQEV
jgi:flagellar protein FlaG